MGLDGVEMIMALEEEFGIDFSDSESERLRTPRDVIEAICLRLRLSEKPLCHSQQAFHRLRRGLMEVLGVKRQDIRPETHLMELAPGPDCRPWWNRLRDAIGARRWPGLSRPAWLRFLLWGLGWVTFAAILCWKFRTQGWAALEYGVLTSLAALLLLELALHAATRRFIYSLPAGITKVSDLIHSALSTPGIVWSREGVAATVKAITMEQLNISENMYGEDKRFLEDLGMGG